MASSQIPLPDKLDSKKPEEWKRWIERFECYRIAAGLDAKEEKVHTVAHNCHIKTKCSQQITKRSHHIQIAHIKFKSLTSNSNRSHQIQIAHSKFKSLTANYKSLTANSNRPQQIQIVHSKLKSLTANSNCSHQITNYTLGVFGYLQPAVQLV